MTAFDARPPPLPRDAWKSGEMAASDQRRRRLDDGVRPVVALIELGIGGATAAVAVAELGSAAVAVAGVGAFETADAVDATSCGGSS